jgi:hypothetical protein
MPLNIPWAIGEVSYFISRCEQHRDTYDRGGDYAYRNPATKEIHVDVIGRIPVIEDIADRIWPRWRDHMSKSVTWDYDPMLRVARQLLVQLQRKDELAQNLGEVGPTLSVSTMQSDVWDAAKSLWKNRHFGEAVSAAARSVNAMLQTKVNRRDISETKLISECFSLDPPKAGCPRLRLMADDGSDTYKNLHAGALAFGQGCFKAIRNVLAHEYGPLAEPPEAEALHYLAAFSVLAGWIDKAKVET